MHPSAVIRISRLMLGLLCLIDGAFCALKSSYLNSNSIAIALSRFKKRLENQRALLWALPRENLVDQPLGADHAILIRLKNSSVVFPHRPLVMLGYATGLARIARTRDAGRIDQAVEV